MAVSSAQMNLVGQRPLLGGAPPTANPNVLAPQTAAFPMHPSGSLLNPASAATRPALTNPAAAFSTPAPFTGGMPVPQRSGTVSNGASPNTITGGVSAPTNPFTPTPPSPLQNPGNNFTNPGYTEQGVTLTQNRLLEDPYSDVTRNLANQASQPSQGETRINDNLGTLDGPGQGSQYWSQVQGQFNDPMAGEQFTRQATQNYSPSGPSGAFNDRAQSDLYDNFTGFTGAGNAQGQYGQSQSQIGNGTQGQNNMAQIAGGYDQNGQYTGPNRAGGQYEQTQQAFGDMPIANFDPFYDRARQLGVQSYNQDAAGRGVYGSSEALSGVGNVITDIEAQRANRSFDAEMQRAQEQRARQELLGNQARMGDLSGTDAFAANLKGVETYGNLNNQMGQLQNQSVDILGNQANNADTQANNAQNTAIAGTTALGDIANDADTAGSRRFEGATNAMNQADQTGIDRLRAGSEISDRADDNEREDYRAETDAATSGANVTNNRLRTASDIADTGSDNDLNRLDSFNQNTDRAEGRRLERNKTELDAVMRRDENLARIIGDSNKGLFSQSQEDFENSIKTEVIPYLQEAGYSQQEQDRFLEAIYKGYEAATRD